MKTIYQNIFFRVRQPFFQFVSICLTIAFLYACNDENPGFNSGLVEENGSVTFQIRIPKNSNPQTTNTRGMTPVQEAEVKEVDILVFEPGGGIFLYNTFAKLITKNPEGSNMDYRFTAMLEEIASCDIVLIANARAIVQSFLTAQGSTPFTKSTLQAGLILDHSNSTYFDTNGKWDTQTPALLPMWGEIQNRQVVKEAVINDATLHRMVARININIAADNFDLREVYLYNSTTCGALVPAPVAWDATWKSENAAATDPAVGKATNPSLPGGWGPTFSPLVYTFVDTEVQDKTCVNEIYTFEAPAGDGTSGPGNTFLVIGGLYEGSTTVTYYRIDIAEKNQTGVYEYLPLLRNHTYEFTLKRVDRKGYATAEMAAEAGPENTDVILVIENDSELRYYISDSHYYVGITERIVRLNYSVTNQTHSMKIKTNYTAGWNVTVSGSETDIAIPCTWLTINTPLPSTGQELSYTVTPNDAWAVRQAYLHINAGVEMVVTIEQDSKDAVELPTLTPTGEIPSAGQFRTVTVTGLFDTNIPIRVRNKYDMQALDSQVAPANASDGGVSRIVTLNIPVWNNDDPRTLVFEYQDPGSQQWVQFHEDIQLGYGFEVNTSLPEGGVIPEKPGISDYTVTVSGSAWPVIYLRAINSLSLEVISDPVTIAAGNDGIAKTAILPVHAYGQWNDQDPRTIELQWSKDNIRWTTLRNGIQRGWYRITGIPAPKIYHPATVERSDISHDGARVVVTVEGDFADGVVEVRLGSPDVQVERTGGDGISANIPTELLCRYNRTLLTRNIPVSYRIFVNNSWQEWTYEKNGTGNIQTFTQPSIACEMPVTGRIIARENAIYFHIPQGQGVPGYWSEDMPWAAAMGIEKKGDSIIYVADIPAGNYPTYNIDNQGCALYYEGDDPNDPVRGQGKWFLWGDGKNETEGEIQFFVKPNASQLNSVLGLDPGSEYWLYMPSQNGTYMQTVQIENNFWRIAYRYKPESYMKARCVRYPTAGEKEQFENGYAPNVVTTY